MSAQECGLEICSGEITRKRTEQELSFLHGTFLLDLIDVPTKLYQTVWELWPAQAFGFRGDKYITKKVRVVSLAHDMPIGRPLHPYQILSKYLEGYQMKGIKVMYRTSMRSQSDGQTSAMLIAISPDCLLKILPNVLRLKVLNSSKIDILLSKKGLINLYMVLIQS